MPVVTWDRNPPVNYKSRFWYLPDIGRTPITSEGAYHFNNETVTSYRSGKRYSDVADEEELLARAEGGVGVEAYRRIFKAISEQNDKSSGDTGHSFYSYKETIVHSHMDEQFGIPAGSTGSGTPVIHFYRGPLTIRMDSAAYPVLTDLSTSDISRYGRLAINRTAPTQQLANLAQLLAELKQRLPELIGLQTYRNGPSRKSLGGEYLNVEFGLKPLISDVQKLAVSVARVSDIARQLRRDSGKITRRHRVLENSSYSTDVTFKTAAPNMIAHPSFGQYTLSEFLESWGPVQSFDTHSSKVSFAGGFTYHSAEADLFLGKLGMYEQRANILLGTRITPELLWELTPWSWLIDWFSDAGVFFSNLSLLHSDNLVLRYGYIMNQSTAVRTQFQHVTTRSGKTYMLQSTATRKSKRRTKASPYGFDVSLESLSPRQWSILGALGMTRSSRSVR